MIKWNSVQNLYRAQSMKYIFKNNDDEADEKGNTNTRTIRTLELMSYSGLLQIISKANEKLVQKFRLRECG